MINLGNISFNKEALGNFTEEEFLAKIVGKIPFDKSEALKLVKPYLRKAEAIEPTENKVLDEVVKPKRKRRRKS